MRFLGFIVHGFVAVGGLSAPTSAWQTLYWTQESEYPNPPAAQVARGDLNGCLEESLVASSGAISPHFIAIDTVDERIYWTTWDYNIIQRANSDGTNIEEFLTVDSPMGIAFDSAAGKVYWTELYTKKIRRADRDGSNVEDILTAPSTPNNLAIDPIEGRLFWTSEAYDRIYRASFDGSGVASLIFPYPDAPQGLALDLVGGKVYWGESGQTKRIRRANLNGSQVENLIQDSTIFAFSLAVDSAGGKMYWVNQYPPDQVQRSDLSGSNVESVYPLPTGGGLWGVALDGNGMVYWSDRAQSMIQRSNLDGSGLQVVIEDDVNMPRAVVLDPNAGLLFWLQAGQYAEPEASLHRSNADGTGFQKLPIELPYSVYDLAIDPINQKLFLTDSMYGQGVILRCNYDGSNLVSLISEQNAYSTGIAVDAANSKMYWHHVASGVGWQLRRADLDGTNMESPLIEFGYAQPQGLAFDLPRGKLYWGGWDINGVTKIQRSNLNGSEVEEFAPTTAAAIRIAVDSQAGMVYWTEGSFLRRADVAGTFVEDVLESEGSYFGLTIDASRPFAPISLDDNLSHNQCQTGPAVHPGFDCLCADLNGNYHVDLPDFAVIQNHFEAK